MRSAGNAPAAEGERFRTAHLERVEAWLAEQGRASELPLDLHLYWTLFLGVVQFWSADSTHNQEATLALLDRSMALFARGLQEDARS
jgi:hypothetical protein